MFYKKNILNSQIWKSKEFNVLWVSQSLNVLGNRIFLLGLPLFVFEITGSGAQMSFTFAISMLPHLIFGIIGGGLADFWDRKKCLIVGNFLAAIPLITIFILHNRQALEIWHIYILVFLLSCIEGVNLSIFEASIPSIVKKELLIDANSLVEVTNSILTILGPAFAGVLIAYFSASSTILFTAFSCLAAGIIALFIKISKEYIEKDNNKIKNAINNFMEGILFIPKHPELRWGIILSTSTNITMGAYTVLLIFFMTNNLKIEANLIGIVFSLSSIATLLSSVYLASIFSKFKKGSVMVISLGMMGIGIIGLGLSINIYMLILAQFIYMGCMSLYTINWRSLRQIITPNNMMGRVSGVCRGIAYLGSSLGGFLSGVLLTKYNPSVIFIIQGLLIIIFAIFAYRSPLYRSTEVLKETNISS